MLNSFSYSTNFYLEIKCFIEVRLNVLAKHICLFVFPLKIALLCYFIKKVDSGIWVLTSLAKKFSFTQVNIEAACPIVNLKTRTLTENYMIWCYLYSKSSGEVSIIWIPIFDFVWHWRPLKNKLIKKNENTFIW